MKTSWVWEYFEPTEGGAKCKICNCILKVVNSTSSLNKHLYMRHRLKKAEDGSVITVDDKGEDSNDDSNGPAAKLRKTLTDAVRSEEIFESLSKMIVVDNFPISFVAGEGFREFMSTIDPNYIPPSELMMANRLQLQYSATKIQIEDLLSGAKYVALSTDCWSSNPHFQYLTVNAHYIDANWKEKTLTLSTVALDERETTFGASLKKVADAWNITHKVVAVVTDTKPNMKSVVGQFGVPVLACAAHTLHLCVTEAFQDPSLAELLKRVSTLVCHFQHSGVAAKELRMQQLSLGIQRQELVRSNPANWNSTYFMFKSVVESRPAIEAVLENQESTSLPFESLPTFSDSDFEALEELMPLLEPLQIAITTFTGSNSPTSLVRPVINSIVNLHFTKSEPTSESANLSSSFKNTIRKLLINEFQMDDTQPTGTEHLAASIDPRFKNMIHESQPGKDAVISALRTFVNSYSEENGIPATTEDSKPNITLMDKLFRTVMSSQEPTDQIDSFLNESQLCHNDCPLAWWELRAKGYPALADLAKKLLCIPAASASAEHVFSTTGDTVMNKRRTLPSENVDMLVFLNQNKSLM